MAGLEPGVRHALTEFKHVLVDLHKDGIITLASAYAYMNMHEYIR